MERLFFAAGALAALLGVAAGAFGAHGLRAFFAAHPDLRGTYETAVTYHLVHALGLLGVAWGTTRWPGPLVPWAGYLFIAGILLFSGSLYLLVLSQIRALGAITPLGGLAFLAGWALLALAAWRG